MRSALAASEASSCSVVFASALNVVSETGPLISRSEEHTSELQSLRHLVCRLLLEKKKKISDHQQIQALSLTVLSDGRRDETEKNEQHHDKLCTHHIITHPYHRRAYDTGSAVTQLN